MKISHFKYENVEPDGKIKSGGAVEVTPHIGLSHPNGGCGTPTCKCSEGHWMSIGFGRTEDGVVEGISIKFDNREEMLKYLDTMSYPKPLTYEDFVNKKK